MAKSDDRATSCALRGLLVSRSAHAQARIAMSGGRDREQAEADAARYAVTIDDVTQVDERLSLRAWLSDIHSALTGSASDFRDTEIVLRSHNSTPIERPILVQASDVPRAIEKLESTIYRNAALGSIERISLLYYEVLRVHPFSDGNGRTARVLVAGMLRSLHRSDHSLDLAPLLSTALNLHNHYLAAERSGETYASWVRFFAGVVDAEIQLQTRIEASLRRLNAEERIMLAHELGVIQQSLGIVGPSAVPYDAARAPCSPNVFNILRALGLS